MMGRKFDRILDDCLSKMDRGESLIDILAVYPDQEEKLKPLLLVAMLSRAVPQPVPGYTALRLGKNELFAEMATMQSEGAFLEPKSVQPPREKAMGRWIGSLKKSQPAYRFAMLSIVVILAGGFFTLSASASGLAENIVQTLFFSFEQVGDLLLVKPSPPRGIGENPIFSSSYDLPNSPPNYSGEFKSIIVEEEKENENHAQDPAGAEVLAQLQIRMYTFTDPFTEVVDLEEGDLDGMNDEIEEDKDLEKEAKEEEKEAIKDEKEDEKIEEKEDKDAEKDAAEEEKEEEKEDKEDEKVEEKIIKDEEKDAAEEEKEEEKDKDK